MVCVPVCAGFVLNIGCGRVLGSLSVKSISRNAFFLVILFPIFSFYLILNTSTRIECHYYYYYYYYTLFGAAAFNGSVIHRPDD